MYGCILSCVLVASLSLFNRIHGNCAMELHELIPPFSSQSTSRRKASRHPSMVEIPHARTKRFASTFIMRTTKKWNSFPYVPVYIPGVNVLKVSVVSLQKNNLYWNIPNSYSQMDDTHGLASYLWLASSSNYSLMSN